MANNIHEQIENWNITKIHRARQALGNCGNIIVKGNFDVRCGVL